VIVKTFLVCIFIYVYTYTIGTYRYLVVGNLLVGDIGLNTHRLYAYLHVTI